MPFKPPKKQPQFADLKGSLSQSRKTDNALSQTISILIDRLAQLQSGFTEDINRVTPGTGGSGGITATRFATYLTTAIEILALPNSVQLLAGTGITFDDTIPNKRTINSTGSSGGSNHYDSPLSDGDLFAADLIFADGECIIVQVPNL